MNAIILSERNDRNFQIVFTKSITLFYKIDRWSVLLSRQTRKVFSCVYRKHLFMLSVFVGSESCERVNNKSEVKCNVRIFSYSSDWHSLVSSGFQYNLSLKNSPFKLCAKPDKTRTISYIYIYVCVCLCVCTYVSVCVCVCIYMCVCVYIYTYI